MGKLLVFDLETTGVMHWKNGIHQLSGMVVIDGEVKEKFNFKVRPNPAAQIEQESLDVGKVTIEDIKAYPIMEDVYMDFCRMLARYVDKFKKTDKFHLVGYNNASFDNQFLRAFFVQNGDKYFGSWFWSDTIDVMVLASQFLKDVRHKMENFKLMTVAKELGIEVEEEKLHDAHYDIHLTYQAYLIITGHGRE